MIWTIKNVRTRGPMKDSKTNLSTLFTSLKLFEVQNYFIFMNYHMTAKGVPEGFGRRGDWGLKRLKGLKGTKGRRDKKAEEKEFYYFACLTNC
jgi:hypothetical protein